MIFLGFLETVRKPDQFDVRGHTIKQKKITATQASKQTNDQINIYA